MIEQHPNPACGSDVFVHRDPHLQFEADRLGKHRHQFLEAHRNVLLATANSHAGPQRRELRKIAVAAKTEMVAVVQDLLRPYPGVISTRVATRVVKYQMRHIATTAIMRKLLRLFSIR
jgi:hypothetical protein